jgi:hypothetical protein
LFFTKCYEDGQINKQEIDDVYGEMINPSETFLRNILEDIGLAYRTTLKWILEKQHVLI